jgi:SSS family transporter
MNLSVVTVVVLVGYLAGIAAFGSYLGRKRSSVDDYFLAGRSVPWWAIAACVVATETSTLTFTSVPGFSYAGDWSFLQLAFGYVLGRILVSAVLVPAYFKGEVFTSYELLQYRFGPSVRGVAAAVFLVYRTIADGIRLHAAALVIAIVAGIPEYICILALAGAMIFYTEEGGVKATIWTDVIQMFVYLVGAGLILVTVGSVLPGGLESGIIAAARAGKLNVFDFTFDMTITYTFWAGLVGGVFLTLATHGTDHYLVQRLLVARSVKDARTGLVVSGFVVVGQFAFFLLIGSLLWTFYEGREFARVDEVLPTFVAQEMPPAWMGFILAAVAAAALSPSLNSLASTTLKDFYVPYLDPGASEAKQIRLGRSFTVFWGLAQVAVAMVAQRASSALEAGLAVLSYASGPTVGAFLLGVLTKRANSLGTLTGMLAGLIAPSVIKLFVPIAWTWDVAVGASTTFAVGWVVSTIVSRQNAKA